MNNKLINSAVNSILRALPELELPIDIHGIAEIRGVKIIGYPMGDDVSGLLSIENGIGTIGYNTDETNIPRRRFTIAHELGHYELHRNKAALFVDKQFIYRSQSSGDTPIKKEMEHEANLFASMILMPTRLLRQEIEKYDISEEGIKQLADIFDVSTTAMSIRISSLGLI